MQCQGCSSQNDLFSVLLEEAEAQASSIDLHDILESYFSQDDLLSLRPLMLQLLHIQSIVHHYLLCLPLSPFINYGKLL